jgi:RsiW-degrading membrane proteinase PrsW (M82 family)
LAATAVLLHADIHSDYVSAVVGIFIVFVAVLWLFKMKSYQGPVSLRCLRRSLCSLLIVQLQIFDIIIHQSPSPPGATVKHVEKHF